MFIGITLDYINTGEGYSDFPWYALRQQYSSVVSTLGATPIFLPFESYQNNQKILDVIDGLIIPGGDDNIPPYMYRDINRFDFKECFDRAENEKKLLLSCLDRDIPFLGICHGMQLLNVILGGDLYQNLLKEYPNSIDHKQKMSRDNTYHNVKIVENSLLHNLVNIDEFKVNSNHIQAIKNLGNNLIISAYCTDDNVIEAIESTKHSFALGVEWHPEILASKNNDLDIFKGFIKSAKKYSENRR